MIHAAAFASAFDAALAVLPARDYSLQVSATHLICTAEILHHDVPGHPTVVMSANAPTATEALTRLLARWQGRDEVAA